MQNSQTKFKETELGQIPEDWEVLKVKDFAEVIGGGTPSTKDPENFTGDIPWLTPRDLSTYQDRFVSKGERNISEQGLGNSGAKLLPAKSILLTSRAPVGYLAIASDKITTNQGFQNLVPKKQFDSLFLFYLLKNDVDRLKSFATGSTFQELSGGILRKMLFSLPLLDEQQRIAEVLGALDEKIELNRKINKTLEEISRAIFKKWFVDDADPNWEIKKLGDLLDIDRGLSYKGKYLAENGNPMFNLGSFNVNGGLKLDTLKHYTGDFKETSTVRAGDIIVANTDMTQNRDILGSACMIPNLFKNEKVLFTHHIYALRIRNDNNSLFVYHILKTRDFKDQAIGFATGTTVLFLPKEAILNYEIRYPNGEKLKEYNNIFQDILNDQLILTKEIDNLSQIRDSLLPRLMSGKLRIK